VLGLGKLMISGEELSRSLAGTGSGLDRGVGNIELDDLRSARGVGLRSMRGVAD
jgi:hypothetical protein